MPLLEVRDLQTTYHTQTGTFAAVDGISFDVEKGEIVGLVGESGSGKSVACFSIMGLIQPPGEISAGSIRFKEQELVGMDPKKLRAVRGVGISMIFQEPLSSLNPVRTIGWQVTEPLRIHTALSREDRDRKAISMLRRVGIPDAEARFHAYPHQLSGGLRQRVMIAQALICEPDILIADEPTTALDVTIQAQILEMLKGLQSEFGMAIILITHDLGVIAEVADRVAVMYAGRIVETAQVNTLFDETAHPYSAALINSIPEIGTDRDRLEAIDGSIPEPGAIPSGCRFEPRCSFAAPACSRPQRLEAVSPRHDAACIRAQRGDLPTPLVRIPDGADHG